jgi:hypothetical protein
LTERFISTRWREGCSVSGVADTRSSPNDELRDIAQVLEGSRTETTEVRREVESLLEELHSLIRRKPNRPRAA